MSSRSSWWHDYQHLYYIIYIIIIYVRAGHVEKGRSVRVMTLVVGELPKRGFERMTSEQDIRSRNEAIGT